MRAPKIDRNRAKLASQAALCYNEGRNIVASAMLETSRGRTHLTRRYVMDTIPSTSGIYKITCTANKKIYIGSAVNLQGRKRQHFHALRQNMHHNPRLQNAWNKYGEQAFTFEVVEFVLPMSLTAREQYWFHKLKPFSKKGFNIVPNADSNLGRKHTPETIEKLSLSHIGKKLPPEQIEKIRLANTGKKRSPQTIERMSQANQGKKPSPETIAAVRQANLGNTYNLGKKRTPEAKEKMRQAKLRRKEKST